MQSKEWRGKIMKKNEQSPREMQHLMKQNDIRVMGVPKGERREKGAEKLF